MTLTAAEIAEKHNAGIGHNSSNVAGAPVDLGSIVDRIVTLEEERKSIGDDIADLKKEAKGRGFDTKALGVAVKRKMETAEGKAKREAQEQIVDTYLLALGFLD